MTASEKKVAANRRNAQRSTGPRSASGKERSSKNATKHGIYGGPSPVLAGEFAEDPDEVVDFTMEVAGALEPRNRVENAAARRVAAALLHGARLDRYAAAEIARASRVSPVARLVASPAGTPVDDAELAANSLFTTSLERISVLDARVGREIERALASFERVRRLTTPKE